jgi:hypothetical protein
MKLKEALEYTIKHLECKAANIIKYLEGNQVKDYTEAIAKVRQNILDGVYKTADCKEYKADLKKMDKLEDEAKKQMEIQANPNTIIELGEINDTIVELNRLILYKQNG